MVDAAKELNVQHAIVDGEIIVTNEAGVSDFAALRKAITRRQHDLYFVAFDLLHLNGHDLRDMPPEDRREILAEMIPKAGASNSAKLCMAMRRRSSIWSSRPGWRGWFQSGRTANTEAARRRIG
ncbi:hypothetical protein GCM10007880_17030 [Mesorhizobium amorphae]|nr:hypothetical protein GCM10007880_17030 [Mesorhizobium amorphae]